MAHFRRRGWEDVAQFLAQDVLGLQQHMLSLDVSFPVAARALGFTLTFWHVFWCSRYGVWTSSGSGATYLID
jgi:hypothetical protein